LNTRGLIKPLICLQVLGFIFFSPIAFAQSNDPELTGILSNQGNINSVFINHLHKSSGTSIKGWSRTADHFLKQGISVCEVTNILCNGLKPCNAILTDTSTCEANTLGFTPSDSVILTFQFGGIFNCTRILNAIELIDFVKTYFEALDALKWSNIDSTLNGQESKFKVLAARTLKGNKANNFSLQFTKFDFRNIISKEETKTTYASSNLSSIIYNINLCEVCPNRPVNACIRDLDVFMDRFAQDTYHVREGNAALHVRNRFSGPSSNNMEMFRIYSGHLCNGNTSTLDPLIIKGGNLFRCDSIVFIGSDAKYKYSNCSRYSNSLGLDTHQPLAQVEAKLVEQIAGSNGKAALIWAGRGEGKKKNCRFDDDDLGFQPLYHLDMYFHPLGRFNESAPQSYYYLVSTLDTQFHHIKDWTNNQRDEFETLRMNLEQSADSLCADIEKLKLTPVPIEIPLLVDFDNDSIVGYVAFVNGHSSVSRSSACFYMPYYKHLVASSDTHPNFKYEMALRSTISNLEKYDIHVDSVPTIASDKSGLHCQVKILK